MDYFDYAATTPLHPDALHVYGEIAQQSFGNTSSLHEVGSKAENMLEFCRKELAHMLDVDSAGIFFTSGGTESNLLSIISLAKANKQKGNHIITTLGEHASIDSAMAYLENDGFIVTKVPFTQNGIVNVSLLEKAITNKTILISVQHINPEIGTIQPLNEIAKLIENTHILLHSDTVQSFGKMDLKPIAKIVDSLTISSHKLYGPKGIGAVYINPRHLITPVFPGLTHEGGFRGGTINLPAIGAFITAARIIDTSLNEQEKYTQFREILLTKLAKYPNSFTIYQANIEAKQLPHIIGLGITGMEGQLTMLELNRSGFAVSTGSACQIGQHDTSKAMMALHIDANKAREFIRVSFGKSTTRENVERLANQLVLIKKT